MLHILSEPGLATAVREELAAAGYPKAKPEENINILPSETPLLRSIWHETLRMHNNSLTVREVIEDTKLGARQTWDLQKGNVVTIPCGLMHFDERLHPDPDNFHAKRFMDKTVGGEGESHSRTTKPFGGGSTHCPGRVFAEKQMIGLVAALIMRYDIEITSPDWKMPIVSEFDSIMNEKPVYFRYSKRVVG
jgi:cytochrome P450